MDLWTAVLVAAIPIAVALLIGALYSLRVRRNPAHPENALRKLRWSARRRVWRAVLLGERLSNPDEAEVAMRLARRRMKRPWEAPLFPVMGILAAVTSLELYHRARGGSESSLLAARLLGVLLAFAILFPIELRGGTPS